MKDYRRSDPLFSLCGLNCGLCTMRLGGYCPGCGGGEGHQPCAIIRCSREHGGVEYCYLCAEFPCDRYRAAVEFDSFLSHRRMIEDLERAREIGIEAYREELAERMDILRRLLEGYNDGRRKSLFCTAAALLPLPELRRAMEEIDLAAPPDGAVKERAVLAAARLEAAAGAQGVSLKLRKKPRQR